MNRNTVRSEMYGSSRLKSTRLASGPGLGLGYAETSPCGIVNQFDAQLGRPAPVNGFHMLTMSMYPWSQNVWNPGSPPSPSGSTNAVPEYDGSSQHAANVGNTALSLSPSHQYQFAEAAALPLRTSDPPSCVLRP